MFKVFGTWMLFSKVLIKLNKLTSKINQLWKVLVHIHFLQLCRKCLRFPIFDYYHTLKNEIFLFILLDDGTSIRSFWLALYLTAFAIKKCLIYSIYSKRILLLVSYNSLFTYDFSPKSNSLSKTDYFSKRVLISYFIFDHGNLLIGQFRSQFSAKKFIDFNH